MFQYQAYGLTLKSALPLSGFLPGKGRVDICIDFDSIKSVASDEHSPIRCLSATPKRVHLTWGTVGDLLIEEGRQITIIPCLGADQRALCLFVLGAGLGVVLYQRRMLVFHASGVVIHDRVVGFIGAKGWGKSTTAAILLQRGHALVSDELLAVRFDAQDQPLVIPGSPQMRLWSDALVSTGGNPNSAAQVRSGIDKFNVTSSTVATQESPFHCLYLLNAGEVLSIDPILSSEAFFSVLPHLYVFRFGTPFLQSTHFDDSFQQLKSLLQKVVC